MEVAGAVASITGIVAFGFTLATVITTYIGDYQDASEDISNLAGEVTTTFRHIEQLQKLIDSNNTNTATKAFSDSGLLEAEACKLKARQLADRLWKLVKKSNAVFPADGSLSAEHLEISIFSKAKWPSVKPRVEQHKHELVVLNTNILICMVGYRLGSGAPPADQVRATEELDRLKRSKKMALRSLREAQKRRKRKKGKGSDDRRPHFSDDEPLPIRQGSGYPYIAPSVTRGPSRAGSYDDYYRDGDGRLQDEVVIENLVEDVRKDLLLQMEKDRAAQEEAEVRVKTEREEAVEKYKNDLVTTINQSSQDAENLKMALVKAFPATVSENSAKRFVEEQRQAGAIKEDQVAQLMLMLVARSEVVSNGDVAPVRIAKVLKDYADWRRTKRRHARTSIANVNIFSVIISVDGTKHSATPVNVPTPYTDKLLTEQESKGWWKGASFKETLQTYARLDLQSRNVAESEADKLGIDSGQLVLLFARVLDKDTTKGRKLLEATMMASNPWEYFHGRALLIYKVSDGNDERSSTSTSYMSGPRSRRRSREGSHARSGLRPVFIHHGDGPGYYGDTEERTRSRRRQQCRSRSRSRSLDRRDSRYDTYGAQDIPFNYENDSREGHQVAEEYRGYREQDNYGTKSEFQRSSGRHGRSGEETHQSFHTYPAQPHPFPMSTFVPERRDRTSGREPRGYQEWYRGYRPTYAKVHRKYLSEETLKYYSLPYEIDRNDWDYIIIFREMDQHEMVVLFEHTRRLWSYRAAYPHQQGSRDHFSRPGYQHASGTRFPPKRSSLPDDIVEVHEELSEDGANDQPYARRSRSGMAPPTSEYPTGGIAYAEKSGLDTWEPSGTGHQDMKGESRHAGRSPSRRDDSYDEGMRAKKLMAEAQGMYSQGRGSEQETEPAIKYKRAREPRSRYSGESNAGQSYDEINRLVDMEEGRSGLRVPQLSGYSGIIESRATSRKGRYSALERDDGDRSTVYGRPASAFGGSRISQHRSVSGRSRLRSRAREYDRRHEAKSVAEEKEEQDSVSDLFESEMSEISGDERGVGKKARSNGKQRERGSGSGSVSVLGLESTTESPSSFSDSQDVPKANFTLHHSRGRDLFGYIRPYAETVKDYEPSRRNTADSVQSASQVTAVRVVVHNPDTDEEATYQTAVESHGEDDFEDAVGVVPQRAFGVGDEAARSNAPAGQQADTEVFHDGEEPVARASGGSVVKTDAEGV
ncbi:hypothetical protein LTR54_014666 [Friedmanniomyces endolithicus]|uniref:Fungal N-terminal domain-containing protein n=1 Tax=Friedmanniomyces endolithicus TaxID=329885 RepID=A0AAN6J5H5_9PEZI|nr:hypothetical protein LTS00_013884 [Friedmanniomyces endolithicus]KAK0316923.1 hypothetical protein LTR82_012065 [Friedmanniomyces endolithicus]KAK0982436.1 hypothetical protein LTR54_014666 [Friedmanniomyces endolithicus]